jgi:LmbE family N-acetylglucosaminyl deacetylase
MPAARISSLPRRLYRRARSLRAGREERGFRSALRADPAAPVLILSPHLDDAVLDCWSVLAGDSDVNVVNIFAGVPERTAVTLWDDITGAQDSSARVRERIDEDGTALARAGRAPVNLPFLDHQYRRPPGPDLSRLDAAISAAVPAASHVYAPAGIGSHPDHKLARRYARLLVRGGMPVTLYAELPYCVLHGWPDWVDGRAPDAHRNVDAFWRSFLTEVPELGELRSAEVVRLSDAAAQDKLAAMRSYVTQFAALGYGARGLLDDPEIFGYEVRWELPAPAANSSPR